MSTSRPTFDISSDDIQKFYEFLNSSYSLFSDPFNNLIKSFYSSLKPFLNSVEEKGISTQPHISINRNLKGILNHPEFKAHFENFFLDDEAGKNSMQTIIEKLKSAFAKAEKIRIEFEDWDNSEQLSSRLDVINEKKIYNQDNKKVVPAKLQTGRIQTNERKNLSSFREKAISAFQQGEYENAESEAIKILSTMQGKPNLLGEDAEIFIMALRIIVEANFNLGIQSQLNNAKAQIYFKTALTNFESASIFLNTEQDLGNYEKIIYHYMQTLKETNSHLLAFNLAEQFKLRIIYQYGTNHDINFCKNLIAPIQLLQKSCVPAAITFCNQSENWLQIGLVTFRTSLSLIQSNPNYFSQFSNINYDYFHYLACLNMLLAKKIFPKNNLEMAKNFLLVAQKELLAIPEANLNDDMKQTLYNVNQGLLTANITIAKNQLDSAILLMKSDLIQCIEIMKKAFHTLYSSPKNHYQDPQFINGLKNILTTYLELVDSQKPDVYPIEASKIFAFVADKTKETPSWHEISFFIRMTTYQIFFKNAFLMLETNPKIATTLALRAEAEFKKLINKLPPKFYILSMLELTDLIANTFYEQKLFSYAIGTYNSFVNNLTANYKELLPKKLFRDYLVTTQDYINHVLDEAVDHYSSLERYKVVLEFVNQVKQEFEKNKPYFSARRQRIYDAYFENELAAAKENLKFYQETEGSEYDSKSNVESDVESTIESAPVPESPNSQEGKLIHALERHGLLSPRSTQSEPLPEIKPKPKK